MVLFLLLLYSLYCLELERYICLPYPPPPPPPPPPISPNCYFPKSGKQETRLDQGFSPAMRVVETAWVRRCNGMCF
jgi:hypothetical protein